jgi:transcriptional regulator NrdR family protein
VESREIGELVADRLKDVDEIAYVRFASEYYQFRNVGDILKQLEEMNQRVRDVPNQQALFEASDGDGKAKKARSGGDE